MSSAIKIVSFDHQWYYRYRLHTDRSRQTTPALHDFLESVFDGCPHHLFRTSRFRCSRCKVALGVPLKHFDRHEIIALADGSRGYTKMKSAHENLQKCFLDTDPGTIAAEIPVWLEESEHPGYRDRFGTGDALTGHIDVLRFRSDEQGWKIEVWDYKPGARKERYAATQVFLYAYMLSIRTGVPLSQFSCGYFDETDAFTFDPVEAEIPSFEAGRKKAD